MSPKIVDSQACGYGSEDEVWDGDRGGGNRITRGNDNGLEPTWNLLAMTMAPYEPRYMRGGTTHACV